MADKSSKATEAFAAGLMDDQPIKLKAGESTPTLEAQKAEGNVALEAMKLMSNTLLTVAKANSRAKTE